MNLIQRERKFDVVVLFYALAFGFNAGSERSIQAFFGRHVDMADLTELCYSSFCQKSSRSIRHARLPAKFRVSK